MSRLDIRPSTQMRITLDTNCLVDLELEEGAYADLQRIVASHNDGITNIAIPGICASERLKGGSFADSFDGFRERLRRISRREFEILRPPCYLDITYLDWSVLGGEGTLDLERQIHDVLFPAHEFSWEGQARSMELDPDGAFIGHHKESLKWRNRKCDVLSLWCHIFYGNDVFITTDRNFHKRSKKPLLIGLGAKRICRPSELTT